MTEHVHDPLELQDFLDGRLTGADEARVRRQPEACADCRTELSEIERGRSLARQFIRRVEAPRDALTHIQDVMDVSADVPGTRPVTRRRFVGYGLAAAAAGVVAALYVRRRTNLPGAVISLYDTYARPDVTFAMATGDAARLEQFFNERIPIRIHVIDLGMMQYHLLGGSVEQIAGRPSAASTYAGPGAQRLVCVMFGGRLDELPAPSRRETFNGIAFSIYRQRQTTAVFWAEGPLICALVSDLSTEDVLALAHAKAMKV